MNALTTLTGKLAQRFDMGDGDGLVSTLKATAFKGQVTDAQMVALLVVANQFGLNPWTKEIYAFPDKNNGIVPVVGVDGWARIINEHPAFDGMDFQQDAESCTCVIYRKDRSHPIKVTEWMDECRRGTGPWQSHPKRMLRHKAMIQAARVAFGYGGIFDQDEAERIVEASRPPKAMGAAEVVEPMASPELVAEADTAAAQGIAAYSDWWQRAGRDKRQALAAGHEERKRKAHDADAARTVDAEPMPAENADFVQELGE